MVGVTIFPMLIKVKALKVFFSDVIVETTLKAVVDFDLPMVVFLYKWK